MTQSLHPGCMFLRLVFLWTALLLGGTGAEAAGLTFASADGGVCDVHLIRPDGTNHRVAACGSPVAALSGDLVWLERERSITSEIVPVGETTRPVLFDRAGDVTRFSAPLLVAPGAATTVKLHAETAASALAFLTFPAEMPVTDFSVELVGESPRAPSVVFQGSGQAVALWSGISDRRASVNAQSKELLLEPQAIVLRAGRVTTLRAALSPRPKITVAVEIDEESRTLLDVHEMRIAVTGSNGALLEEAVLNAPFVTTIDELPADVIRVVLSVGKMKFQRRADLRSAREADVRFPLVPIVVSGTVYLGRNPVEAELRFMREGVAPVKTDVSGRYEITLWEPGPVVVEITLLDERDSLPFSELKRVEESQEIDFRIPIAQARFDVTDSASGRPVEGARLVLKNTWQEPGGRRSANHRAQSDKAGHVQTPRLRSGSLEVRVEADGYRVRESLVFPIDDATNATFPIALEPLGHASPVKISLPGGPPAARAAVWLVTAGGQVVFSGTADLNGSIDVPEGQATDLLLVSHPGAGATAVPWSGALTETGLRLSPKGPPFSAHVVRSDGASARAGSVYVWIGGLRLGGTALALLTGTSPATQASGLWEVGNLPAAPLTILITTAPPDRVNAGLYDSLATTISFPWSGLQTIRIVE